MARRGRFELPRRVTRGQGFFRRQHQIPMGVLHIDHALGPDNADLDAVNGARPDHRQRPTDIHGKYRAVVHGEQAKGRVLGTEARQDLVRRPRVDAHRGLAFHEPHGHVQAVGTGDHHRRQVLAIAGLLDGGNGHHAIHQCTGYDRMHIADLTGCQPFLDSQETAAKSLRITHAGIHAGLLDGSEDLRRLAGVGGQGLLDEQFVPAIHGRQRRGGVVVLVRQDHRGVYFRPAEQLVERRREIVGVGLLRQFAPGLFADVAKAEPADARILACALGANAANGAAADNGKTDGFVAVAHSVRFPNLPRLKIPS